MNDIPSTARSARESLSRGLSALQSDPTVPAGLLDIAGSIAQAMGALHQIERSNGAVLNPHADTALASTRAALSQLQAQATNHPAVQQAMEAVAGSLGMVHSLSRLAAGSGATQAAPPQAIPQPQAPQQQWQPQAQPPPQQQQQQWQPPAQPPGAYGPPPQQQPAYGPPPQQQQAYAPPPPQQPAFPPPQQQAYAPPPQQQQAPRAAADPFAPQRSPLAGTAVAGGAPMAPMAPMHSKNPPAPPGGGDMPLFEAELGAHSATNFYKGLSGNDIIDHGGLFVATYKIPKQGTPIRLKVALPGGYEFEANAIVKWRREASEGGDPGFGAQITGISPEARQLVYRYVRNREPLFHDDL